MNQTEILLKKEVKKTLLEQGYRFNGNLFLFDKNGREEKRNLHLLSRAERIKENIDFIQSFSPKASQYLLDSSSIEVEKIKPKLIEVSSGTKEAKLFRWWNLTWWSLPFERAYGRQMRFIVWDEYHNAPIGLIGLQSPILSWSVRDNYLNINAIRKDYWVNQSLSAQRLGSLPPYNKFLGGKLVASLMMSDTVRHSYKKKYHNNKTLLLERTLPADLLFITTTGAYGKSSVYNRLKFQNEKICEFIGYTSGHGSFHIPNTLYENFINYLQEKGYKGARSFGNGPSIKMRNINQTMHLLGFKNGSEHGIKRAVYIFPFIKNLISFIQSNEKLVWYERSIEDLTDSWQEKWASKRIDKPQKTAFLKKEYFRELSEDLTKCRELIRRAL